MISRFSAALAAVVASGLAAQNVAWVATGMPDRKLHGFKADGVGDTNGDGYEDLMCVVTPYCTGLGYLSLLWLISGRDGVLLREHVSGGAFSGVGDWDQDGGADYMYPQTMGWLICRGIDGVVLQVIPPQVPVLDKILGDIDLDGDGQSDLLFGTWTAVPYGMVRAISRSGQVLYEIFGDWSPSANPPLSIARQFCKLGDIDGDGCDDFAMGCGEPTNRGAVAIVSGKTGTYIRVCYGELPGDFVGGNVTACGDLDGDGCCDVAVGQFGQGFLAWRGVVRVFSSRTGAVLYQWVEIPRLGFSDFLSSRGVDIDGDGVGDIMVGQPDAVPTIPGAPYGRVYVYSGRTGSLIQYIDTQPSQAGVGGYLIWPILLRAPVGEHVGFTVCSNDVTLFGWGTCTQHPFGSMVAYRGLPRTAVEMGPSCPGLLPDGPAIGMSSLGPSGVRLHVSHAPPNTPAVLLIGLSTTQYGGLPLPAPLDPLGLPGCFLRTSIELMHVSATGTLGLASGYAFVDVPHPVPVTGMGQWSLSAQWWALGDSATFPGGMSQAIRWRQ